MNIQDMENINHMFLISGIAIVDVSKQETIRVIVTVKNREDRKKIYRIQEKVMKKYPKASFDFQTNSYYLSEWLEESLTQQKEA